MKSAQVFVHPRAFRRAWALQSLAIALGREIVRSHRGNLLLVPRPQERPR